MCGFSGVFGENASHKKELIKKCMLDMSHRGPDFSGLETLSNYVIGHNRLAIRDLSEKGNQPMYSSTKRFLIAYNGEIYNTLELVTKFKLTSYKNESDTSILLKLFEILGVQNSLNTLDGMFSISVYDLLEKKVYLARDSFGIKPLFYALSDNYLIFSSEVKPLARHFGYTIRDKSVSSYLDYGYVRDSFTLFNEYVKVKPGEILILTFSEIEKISLKKDSIKLKRTENSVINSINKSVNSMLISDVNVGLFLSGGIDSSLTAAFIKRKTKNFYSHTVKFNIDRFDESKIARETSNYLGINHKEHLLDENIIINSIKNIGDLLDEPISDSSFLATYFISKKSSEHSKVVLSGDGADELFVGYKRYKNAKKSWLLFKLFKLLMPIQNVRYSLFNIMFNIYKLKFRHTSKNNFLNKLKYLDNCKNAIEFYNIFTRKMFISSLIYKNYDKDYSENKIKFKNNLSGFANQDMLEYLSNNILIKLDQSTMRNSQEGRVPFLDQRVLESKKLMDNKNQHKKYYHKKILKKHLKSLLPEYPVKRKKTGFTVPLDIWMKEDLKTIFENEILNCSLEFNKLELQKLWNDHIVKNSISNKDIIYSIFVLNKYLKSI